MRVLLLSASLCALPARAHDLDRSNSIWVLEGEGLQGAVTVSLTAAARSCALDEDGDGTLDARELDAGLPALYACVGSRLALRADGEPVRLERGSGRLSDAELLALLPAGRVALDAPEHPALSLGFRAALGRRPARLAAASSLHELFRPGHAHILRMRTPAGDQAASLGEGSPRAEFAAGGTISHARLAWTFTKLGVKHIFIGVDHILFLLALILLGGRFADLLRIVTAFTVAHSVTLALAALELAALPSRLVECGIALSIAYVAAENFFVQRAGHRWVLTFCFGLIHGFGFAGVLAEIGLPREGLALSLLAFNLGIELGQVAIFSALFPLVLYGSRRPGYRRAMLAGSAVILLCGLAWFVERAFGLRFMPV